MNQHWAGSAWQAWPGATPGRPTSSGPWHALLFRNTLLQKSVGQDYAVWITIQRNVKQYSVLCANERSKTDATQNGAPGNDLTFEMSLQCHALRRSSVVGRSDVTCDI